MLALAYGAGDAWAKDRIGEGAAALGWALAAVHLAIGVDRFVLVGGFAVGLGQTFCEAVRDAAGRACWQGEHPSIVVALGEADGNCALVGAGRAAQLRARATLVR
jgi:glucokinase